MTPETLVSEQSPFKGKTGVRRVLNALRYSMDGLRAAYTGEDAFRQEILLAAVLIPLALCPPINQESHSPKLRRH